MDEKVSGDNRIIGEIQFKRRANLDRWHQLWYGPFLWGDGSKHPCPVDGSMHGEGEGDAG